MARRSNASSRPTFPLVLCGYGEPAMSVTDEDREYRAAAFQVKARGGVFAVDAFAEHADLTLEFARFRIFSSAEYAWGKHAGCCRDARTGL